MDGASSLSRIIGGWAILWRHSAGALLIATLKKIFAYIKCFRIKASIINNDISFVGLETFKLSPTSGFKVHSITLE